MKVIFIPHTHLHRAIGMKEFNYSDDAEVCEEVVIVENSSGRLMALFIAPISTKPLLFSED